MSVIYSATCGYAIHALCRIASHHQKRRADGEAPANVGVAEICDNTGLSPAFVSKILYQITRAGLLHSSKGRNGGFRLAKPADSILLMEVVDVMDGANVYSRCAVSSFERCNDQQHCPQHESFKPLRERIIRYLQNTTIAQLTDALHVKQTAALSRPRRVSLTESE